MLNLDHIAITVKDLEQAVSFYTKLGYKLLEKFHDEDYDWVVLRFSNHSLELFQITNGRSCNLSHIAYNYENDNQVIELIKSLGYKKDELDIFYGNLDRKSFFIEDKNGNEIQFIKK